MVAVLLHLTVAALLRAVMRRAAVDPWIATIFASAFVLFGPSHFNAEYPFQMAWGMALALGLGALLLVDHDGPLDRRDGVGLLLGLVGLMCAGVSVGMTVVVVIALLLRHGWRIAAVFATPLGAAFLVWWAAIGRSGYTRHATPAEAVRFMIRNLWATFRAFGQLPGLGVALIVLMVGGLLLRLAVPGESSARSAIAPVALLLGAPVFLLIIGTGGRGALVFGAQSSNVSRYLHVAAVLTIPALGVAADALFRWSRPLGALAIALMVVGIPGNVQDFVRGTDGLVAQTAGSRSFILSAARNPIAKHLPRTSQVYPFSPGLTMGWLLDGIPSGRVPDPGPLSPYERANQTLILAVRPSGGVPTLRCRPLRAASERVLVKGDALRAASGRVDVTYLAPGGARSASIRLASKPMLVFAGPLRVQLVPFAELGKDPVLCG
jgi:hypothetical protein